MNRACVKYYYCSTEAIEARFSFCF